MSRQRDCIVLSANCVLRILNIYFCDCVHSLATAFFHCDFICVLVSNYCISISSRNRACLYKVLVSYSFFIRVCRWNAIDGCHEQRERQNNLAATATRRKTPGLLRSMWDWVRNSVSRTHLGPIFAFSQAMTYETRILVYFKEFARQKSFQHTQIFCLKNISSIGWTSRFNCSSNTPSFVTLWGRPMFFIQNVTRRQDH